MKFLRLIAALAFASAAAPAYAGPPYLTDDPVPTDTGHWEIYAFTAAEGRHSTIDADAGFDLNYGPVEGVQPRFRLVSRTTRLKAGAEAPATSSSA